MLKFGLLALLLAVVPGASVMARSTAVVDPMTVTVEDADAQRFATLFRQTHGKPTAAQLQSHYLDGSGRGVAVFTPGRIQTATNLANAVAADSERYRYAIDTCLPLLPSLTSEMRSIYLAYRGLLPDRKLPSVHVVFGAGNSGGTAQADAQVVGLEVMCGPGTTPDGFRQAMRAIFAHETVHSWQREPAGKALDDPLLMFALREGTADYLASVVTGVSPSPSREGWAAPKEAWVWQQFQQDRVIVKKAVVGPWKFKDEGNAAIRRWIGNYGNAPEGWPFEMGYWVGMKIAAAYVAKAEDKRAAIESLIALDDPVSILQISGYRPAEDSSVR